jgi:hypothetical protein
MRTTEYVYSIANPIMLKKRHCKCRLTGDIPGAKAVYEELKKRFPGGKRKTNETE